MPGSLVEQSATVFCSHMGQAKPSAPNPRVSVSGVPTVLLSAPYLVSGCPFPPNSGGPCVTGQWTSGTVRVTSVGQPLVIQGGSGTCAPTGVPMSVLMAQVRVTAT